MRKRIVIGLSTLLIAVLLVGLYIKITSPQRNLDRMLREIDTVEIGKTKMDDWRMQIERARVWDWDVRCDQRKCGVGWEGENSFLQKVHLAPRTFADASVGFTDGVASEIFVIFVADEPDKKRSSKPFNGVSVELNTEKDPSSCQQRYTLDIRDRYPSGEHYWAKIGMDGCVSRAERARALAINSACMGKIGGCRTLEEILPRVFARR